MLVFWEAPLEPRPRSFTGTTQTQASSVSGSASTTRSSRDATSLSSTGTLSSPTRALCTSLSSSRRPTLTSGRRKKQDRCGRSASAHQVRRRELAAGQRLARDCRSEAVDVFGAASDFGISAGGLGNSRLAHLLPRGVGATQWNGAPFALCSQPPARPRDSQVGPPLGRLGGSELGVCGADGATLAPDGARSAEQAGGAGLRRFGVITDGVVTARGAAVTTGFDAWIAEQQKAKGKMLQNERLYRDETKGSKASGAGDAEVRAPRPARDKKRPKPKP